MSTFRDGRGRVFVLPPHHKPGVRVPYGGSSCANCRYMYMRRDQPHCWEPGFVAWNGSTRIPTRDPHEYCSDWWEEKR